MSFSENCFIAEGAKVIGKDILIGDLSSVWYNAVIRCDDGEFVHIGERTNVQDLCVVHTSAGCPASIGDDVTIGHGCIIHGCTVGDNTLIGMGSIILDGAVVGKNCIIGAGSLVTKGKEIPEGTMAFGRPAKVVRELTEEEILGIRKSAEWYVEEGKNNMSRGCHS